MERKKFFSLFGLGTMGILFTRFPPLKLFSKILNYKKKINVKINTLAVKREKTGNRNV